MNGSMRCIGGLLSARNLEGFFLFLTGHSLRSGV